MILFDLKWQKNDIMYTQFVHFFLRCGHFVDQVATSRLAGEMTITQNRPEIAQSARELAPSIMCSCDAL